MFFVFISIFAIVIPKFISNLSIRMLKFSSNCLIDSDLAEFCWFLIKMAFFSDNRGAYSKRKCTKKASNFRCSLGVEGGTRTHDIQNHNLTL